MTKRISITMSDWVVNEIVGPSKNISSKIEELIIKGYLAQKEKEHSEKTPLLRFYLVTLLKLRLFIHRVLT